MNTHKCTFNILLITSLLALMTAGCETPAGSQSSGPPTTPARQTRFIPNYETPDSQFVQADFNTLASEFIDEYANQYVAIKGHFLGHRQGVGMTDPTTGVYMSFGNIMSASIGAPDMTPRSLSVIWSMEDRELGRPFLNVKMAAPITVYAYVLPPNNPWYMQSRKDMYFNGFPATTILLIRAVPGGS